MTEKEDARLVDDIRFLLYAFYKGNIDWERLFVKLTDLGIRTEIARKVALAALVEKTRAAGA